jgi:hypothetical protein
MSSTTLSGPLGCMSLGTRSWAWTAYPVHLYTIFRPAETIDYLHEFTSSRVELLSSSNLLSEGPRFFSKVAGPDLTASCTPAARMAACLASSFPGLLSGGRGGGHRHLIGTQPASNRGPGAWRAGNNGRRGSSSHPWPWSVTGPRAHQARHPWHLPGWPGHLAP